jgi:hypothetical protein
MIYPGKRYLSTLCAVRHWSSALFVRSCPFFQQVIAPTYTMPAITFANMASRDGLCLNAEGDKCSILSNPVTATSTVVCARKFRLVQWSAWFISLNSGSTSRRSSCINIHKGTGPTLNILRPAANRSKRTAEFFRLSGGYGQKLQKHYVSSWHS